MGALDHIRTGVSQALGALAQADLERSSDAGSTWATLTGSALLLADRPDGVAFGAMAHGEEDPQGGSLTVAEGGDELSSGDWVRETRFAPARAWEVDGEPILGQGKRTYRLIRVASPSDAAGPDRGRTR